MPQYRYFKANIVGGFRLSDLNVNVKQGSYFYLESDAVDVSRGATAALRDKWMIEVSEKEASKYVSVPRAVSKAGVQTSVLGTRHAVKNIDVATPNVKEVNRSLESRQAEAGMKKKAEEVILPNFKEVEERNKTKFNDSLNKVGSTTESTVGEKVATPNIAQVNENIKNRQLDSIPKQQVLKPPVQKAEETVKVIKSLSVDEESIEHDNSAVVTPETVKTAEEQPIKRRRRRRVEEPKE